MRIEVEVARRAAAYDHDPRRVALLLRKKNVTGLHRIGLSADTRGHEHGVLDERGAVQVEDRGLGLDVDEELAATRQQADDRVLIGGPEFLLRGGASEKLPGKNGLELIVLRPVRARNNPLLKVRQPARDERCAVPEGQAGRVVTAVLQVGPVRPAIRDRVVGS